MSDKKIILFIGVLSGAAGVCMTIHSCGYKLAIALFLLFLSHNLERHTSK